MALTIGPAVSEAERRHWLAVHGLALWLGALTTACVLTIAGTLLSGPLASGRIVAGIVVALALAWIARVVAGVGLPFPRSSWQVPDRWRHTLPSRFVAGGYGYLLGLGFLTDPVLPAFWILVGGSVVAASLPLAAGAWTVYALTRLYMTRRAAAVVAASPDDPPEDVNPRASFAAARAATVLLLAAIAVAAAPQAGL